MTVLRHAVLLLRGHLNGELVDSKGPGVKSLALDCAGATSTAAEKRINGSVPDQRCNDDAAVRSLEAVQTMQVPDYSCHSELVFPRRGVIVG